MKDEQFSSETNNGTLNDIHPANNNAQNTVEVKLNDLLVPVEPYLENRIQEFGPNGEENFVQNISMGEKLLDRAGKIDYKFVIDDNEEEKCAPAEQPWGEVLKELNSSYTEVCVLSDLMALLQQRQYLMLDPVQQPRPAYNTSQVVVAKKMGLKAGAQILSLGAENMRTGDVGKFHEALSNLSSRFKMRKQGSYILGDATYQSSGSDKYYNEEGVFEVKRNDNPLAYPLKVEPDPSVQMLSFLTVSTSDSPDHTKFPTPSYWRHIPFPHAQALGILYSMFTKELYTLMTHNCMATTYHRLAICKAVENLITINRIEGGKLFIRRHIAPPLSRSTLVEPAPILSVDELCLQHHLHKRHKIRYEDDSSLQEGSPYSSMMLGIVNNKPKLPFLLNFELIHHQHQVKRNQIIHMLDDLAAKVKEPTITIRCGPCSTPHESSLNIILSPISRIITSSKVSLRLTIAAGKTYQIDSSYRGAVYNGPDSDMAIQAVKREVKSHVLLMLRLTCTHNLWGILSTDQQEEHIFTQCPNKCHNVTVTVTDGLSVTALYQDQEFTLDRIQGHSTLHKLILFLNVICEPLKPSRT